MKCIKFLLNWQKMSYGVVDMWQMCRPPTTIISILTCVRVSKIRLIRAGPLTDMIPHTIQCNVLCVWSSAGDNYWVGPARLIGPGGLQTGSERIALYCSLGSGLYFCFYNIGFVWEFEDELHSYCPPRLKLHYTRRETQKFENFAKIQKIERNRKFLKLTKMLKIHLNIITGRKFELFDVSKKIEFQTQGIIFRRDCMYFKRLYFKRFYNFSRYFHRFLVENDQIFRKITPNMTKYDKIWIKCDISRKIEVSRIFVALT